ncbi:RNA polymerase sigma factor [Homoserinimonas sp. A520]
MTTDDAIIRRSLDEPSAFGDLFERHGSVIYRYIARRVGHTTAEDVMSETFLTAFRGRSRFDLTRTDARPWLYGIANNLVSRHFAAETRRFALIAAVPADHVAADAFESADARLDAIAHVGGLGPALAALSKADRDTLLLYAWGDLDYEGVAEATGAAVGTVKSRLNRARRRMRNADSDRESSSRLDPDGAVGPSGAEVPNRMISLRTINENGANPWTN